MRRITSDLYRRIDNRIYDDRAGEWWAPASPFYQMKVAFNPVRAGYAAKTVSRELGPDSAGKTALDLGCGGGFMTEEIARLGFETWGLDPSEASLRAATAHASGQGLKIQFVRGTGEAIPFRTGSCDALFCCDVLEHVRDLAPVVAEISRVLKPGGVFCYDTINRTLLSKLVAVKIGQEWKRWAFMPPRLHVWEMFIKPGELRSLLRQNGLLWREHRGIVPGAPWPQLLGYLRKTARGEWPLSELARRAVLVESRSTAIMYMGYAIKA
jgi:2-polyprenyl-6-hydroxyphenyl methylase/3-demethylubiquinone-9 3-methyltransferase